MSPIQKIKEGIISQNWQYVVEGYNQLTGETIEYNNDNDSNVSFDLARVMIGQFLLSLDHDINTVNIEHIDLDEEVIDTESPDYDPRFPTAHLVDPEIQRKLKSIRAQNPRDIRMSYRPNTIKCSKCSKEYDGNKTIKKHVFGGEGNNTQSQTIHRCPFCKTETNS